ncbi:MAG: divergent polysaccharide deacetylase family protein [Fidelibacterota bacterium]
MSSYQTKINRYKKIIGTLIFIIVGMGSILVGLYLKMKTMEPAVIEGPTIEIETAPKGTAVGKIAIIIDDFGYRNDAVSDGFLNLDAHLTYAIIPGHKHSRAMAKTADSKGYEVMIHMPMGTTIPSIGEEEYRIKTSMTSREIEQRVEKVLLHLPEAIGMNNHQGSNATTDKRVMNVLGTVLKQNGKYFLDSRTTKNTQAEMIMRNLHVPTGRRHVFLDNDFDEDLIRLQLHELAEKAKKQGYAVGIGHAKKHTLNVLQDEIPKLKEENLEFVFISEIVH